MLKKEFLKRIDSIPRLIEYNYSSLPNVIYLKDKIEVLCPIHGKFYQRASKHLEGQGCKKCVSELRVSKARKAFNDKATSVHSNAYSYSEVVYIKSSKKVRILCYEHGEFLQTPNKHLMGRGCPLCTLSKTSKILKKSIESFIKDAEKIHKDLYGYEEAVYNGATTKLRIRCRVHGVFLQTPDSHLSKRSGCPECSKVKIGDALTSNTKEFIRKANLVHARKYLYDVTKYIRSDKPVTIECKEHGEFIQTPSNHLAGKGCKRCSKGGGFDSLKSAILYYVSIDEGKYYKIGITNKSVIERFGKQQYTRISVIRVLEYDVGLDAYIEEQRILKGYKEYLTTDTVLRDGNTEIFTKDILGLDSKNIHTDKKGII